MVYHKMDTKMHLPIFVFAAAMVIATVSMAIPALADKDSSSEGVEKADDKVHENTGPVSDQDVRFHEGLCEAGITTEALEDLGGCDILTPPGESENKP
jgi:hypothetical protein